ncbi:hypothetical protein ACS0TY_000046 [Phlomoides rotata]
MLSTLKTNLSEYLAFSHFLRSQETLIPQIVFLSSAHCRSRRSRRTTASFLLRVSTTVDSSDQAPSHCSTLLLLPLTVQKIASQRRPQLRESALPPNQQTQSRTSGNTDFTDFCDDLENFGDVSSLEDNVESFLSHDGGDGNIYGSLKQTLNEHKTETSKAGKKITKPAEVNSSHKNGTSWAVELGSEQQLCPIIVKDLDHPGHMLIEADHS